MSTACQRQRSTADAVVSLLLTALASLGFLWAAAEWIDLVPAARQDDPARMKKNEKLAYMRLRADRPS